MGLRLAFGWGWVALCVCYGAAGDGIVIDGKQFRNVLVSESSSMVYVRDPETGDSFSVMKSTQSATDITLSERKERRELQTEWRVKSRTKKKPRVSGTLKMPKIVLPADKGDAAKGPSIVRGATNDSGLLSVDRGSGSVHFTNRPNDFARRQEGRKIFMDSSGVGLLTNTPGKFAHDEEYMEVTIPYETINVPQRFVTTKETASLGLSPFDEIVQYYAGQYRLDPLLVYAVIRQESNFNPEAISSAGAAGLMQLMPGTAIEMGVKNIFDPAENVAGGTQYLAQMLKLFEGDTDLALAGYNAGPGNVRAYRGVPPFRETQNYIVRVKKFQAQYAREGAPRVRVAAAPLAPARQVYTPPKRREYIQIVLTNGMITSAERLTERKSFYHYEFKHKSGVIQKKFVREIVQPVAAAD